MWSIQAAATLVPLLSICSAALVPPFPPQDSSYLDITSVAGSTEPDHVSFHFQAPCQGCFIGTDDGLELTLDINSSPSECSGDLQTRINGVPLTSSGLGELQLPRGDVTFTAKLTNGLGERQIEASWELACLKGEASILTVQFHGVAGQSGVKTASGFTTSFHQVGQPLVLRLQAVPVEDIDSPQVQDAWLQPEEHQRVVVMSLLPFSTLTSADELDHKLAKLKALKSHVGVLKTQIHETEKHVMLLVKSEFKSCSNLKCLFATAMHKAPDLVKLVKTHWRHHSNRHDFFEHGTHSNCTDKDGDVEQELLMTQHDEYDSIVEEVDDNVEAFSVSPPAPPSPPSVDDTLPPCAHHPLPPSPSAEDGHRRPWAYGPPFQPPPGGRTRFGAHPDHPHQTFGGLPHLRPFTISPSQQSKHHLLAAVAILVIGILIIALLFACIRRGTRLCRDPRRRADRAARREERNTRRLYRKAACKHKWTKWLSRYRRPDATSDYEEKRELILEQEGVLEDVMQREISSLRTAHELVGELVRAEEGRARLYFEPHLPPSQRGYGPAELNAGVGSSNSSSSSSSRRRQTDSLPAYIAPPPQYEEELSGDLTVVDGFTGYTPSSTDYTPESSVVDCSPRLSFETQRTAFSRRLNE